MKDDKEELAFPLEDKSQGGNYKWHLSLTKREWFAWMIIQGMISSCISDEQRCEQLAKEAFVWADAMIEASKK